MALADVRSAAGSPIARIARSVALRTVESRLGVRLAYILPCCATVLRTMMRTCPLPRVQVKIKITKRQIGTRCRIDTGCARASGSFAARLPRASAGGKNTAVKLEKKICGLVR